MSDDVVGVRSTQIHEEERNCITNCPASSIYQKKKSVLTSGAKTPLAPRKILTLALWDNMAFTDAVNNKLGMYRAASGIGSRSVRIRRKYTKIPHKLTEHAVVNSAIEKPHPTLYGDKHARLRQATPIV